MSYSSPFSVASVTARMSDLSRRPPHRAQGRRFISAFNRWRSDSPLAAFASTRWVTGAMQAVRYNGYPAMRMAGEPAKGVSTGEAIAEMERLAAQLPKGIGYEWTGLAREEKLSGATAYLLFFFSLLAVFLCLAALYESWSIPLAVILVVPLGVLGTVAAQAWNFSKSLASPVISRSAMPLARMARHL